MPKIIVFNMGIDNEISFVMARHLKQLREEKGLSHEKLSKALFDQYGIKISSDSLINYEVADARHTKAFKNQGMRVEYLRVFADFYGVSTDYILGISAVKNQSMDIKMIVDSTGLSEENVMALYLTQTLSSLYLAQEKPDGEIQPLEAEIKKLLHLDKYPIAGLSLAAICFNFKSLINDTIKAATTDQGILFDYGNLRSTAPTIDNFDGSFDPEFQKQLAERGLTSLPAPLYVRFMSDELAKKLDRYFIKKYGRGYY